VGLIFGLLLGLAGKVFKSETSEQTLLIRNALPGANCGGCGFAGCDQFAAAVCAGEAPVNGCPVGGTAVAKKIAAIMGQDAGEVDPMNRMVANVICRGSAEYCRTKYNYSGITDCTAASTVSDGTKSCHYACLGLGTCVSACEFGALHINEAARLVEVDRDKCTGCGACTKVCPKKVLDLQPYSRPVRLLCHANERGRVITDNCKAGCFSCGKCVQACKFGAIEMQSNLPKIDTEKCVGCMMCAEACPTGAIWADWDNRLEAVINGKECIGCSICKKQCHFDAIIGERKHPHFVTNACTGCSACAAKCPKKCISMKTRLHYRDQAGEGAPQEA
jgi:electron transport complex protein RnfB